MANNQHQDSGIGYVGSSQASRFRGTIVVHSTTLDSQVILEHRLVEVFRDVLLDWAFSIAVAHAGLVQGFNSQPNAFSPTKQAARQRG